jgi:membrane-bound metal-dependent hydrolase YbcI (DUF457 family)
MFGQAHAGLGWLVGVAAPGSDRRLRVWCTAAALLPDVDALSMLAGRESYDRFHHTFGHNVFTGLLCVAAAAWSFRRYTWRDRAAAVFFVALCFASHLLTDMKLSGWELYLLWPFSGLGYEFKPNLQLGHPANFVLVGVLMALPWVLAPWKGVTPVEIVSPRLDRLIVNLFRRRKYSCSACGRRCNNRCDGCLKPVCLRHGRVGWRFRVACPSCGVGRPAPAPEGDLDPYLARELAFVRSKEGARMDPEFAAFLDRKLSAGLRRLDAVPRTHPLWDGSDRRPTLAKVADLCRFVLEEAPDDEEARWVLFADKVRTGSADLGFSAIEPLILRDVGSLRWLVAAARWAYLSSGADPVLAMRAPLEKLGKAFGSLESCLHLLASDSDARTKKAALCCFDLLAGRNPFAPPRDARAVP